MTRNDKGKKELLRGLCLVQKTKNPEGSKPHGWTEMEIGLADAIDQYLKLFVGGKVEEFQKEKKNRRRIPSVCLTVCRCR